MHNRRALPPVLVSVAISLLATASSSLAEPGVPRDDSESLTPPPAPVSVAPTRGHSPAPAKPAPVTSVTPSAPLSPPAESSPAAPDVSVLAAPHPVAKPVATYTVVKGDTLASIADKADCSIATLKKMNGLTKRTVKAGQVLKIPANTQVAMTTPTKTAKTAVASAAATPSKKAPLKPQPVQDFDIPASTFASCPVPVATFEPEAEAPVVPSTKVDKQAPIAKLVSPEELETPPEPVTKKSALAASTPPPVKTPAVAPLPPVTPGKKLPPAPDGLASGKPVKPPVVDEGDHADFTLPAPAPSGFASTSSKGSGRGLSSSSSSSAPSAASSSDWGTRFTQQARLLGDKGINYSQSWRPPGESRSWVMDCSNTSRYLYRTTAGITLPRTASDQYYYLHLQNKAWDVPQASNGFADCNYLRKNLKGGDLLFWEYTYRPERQPPITHVMIYLGTNAKGEWIMAGSQSTKGGEHGRRRGGPDIYVFDPTKPSGGYTSWMGLVRHKGRFCAYGRPLEADQTKLNVAAND